MKKDFRFTLFKYILLFLCIFVGVGAIFGSVCMLIRPDGSLLSMENLLPYFEVLPFSEELFQDYTFAGVSLLVVNGLTNIVAAILILFDKQIGFQLGAFFGFILMLWISIQFVIFPPNALDNLYFILGVIQLISGFIAFVYHRQTHFKVFPNIYKDIYKDDTKVVVFYSRLGYTKEIAYEMANKTKANIIEIKTDEPTSGFGGFLWCGRFAMHKWGMKIEPIDVSKYDEVTLISPIWMLGLAAPTRQFLKENKYKINNLHLVLISFLKKEYPLAIKEAECLSDSKVLSVTSKTCRFGYSKQFANTALQKENKVD